MLSRVLNTHKNLVDIVIYDTLANNLNFINHCIKLGVDAVIRVKQNNNNAIKDIKKRVNKKNISKVWENKGERSIFNNLKNEASMGYCFVHGGNAVEAILYCIFIASNLFQLLC